MGDQIVCSDSHTPLAYLTIIIKVSLMHRSLLGIRLIVEIIYKMCIRDRSTKDYRINFMYDELEDFTVTTSIVKRTAPDAIRQIMGCLLYTS